MQRYSDDINFCGYKFCSFRGFCLMKYTEDVIRKSYLSGINFAISRIFSEMLKFPLTLFAKNFVNFTIREI